MTDYSASYQPPIPQQPVPQDVAPYPQPGPVTPDPVAPYQPPVQPSAPATPNDRLAALPTQAPPSEEIFVEWTAPSRPHKKRNKQYFTTVGIIVFLISLILFFAGQFLPIAVVLAIGFMVYVLEMVPPGMVTCKLSSYGIRVEDTLYYWDEMGRFWFTQRYDQTMLNIEIARFPGRLTLLIGDLDQELLGKVLAQILVMEKPAPTLFEQASERLQKLIPLE